VLLELADAGLYRPRWSQTILDETERSLVGSLNIPPAKAEERLAAMRGGVPEALVEGFEALIPKMRNHPKDRHVLALAVHAGCEAIVTANTADFPGEALAPLGLRAVHPDRFLADLAGEAPGAVWEALDRKRRLYRHPPLTMGEFAARVGRLAPRFAARLLEISGGQAVLPTPPDGASGAAAADTPQRD
jgi:hypothetical protein